VNGVVTLPKATDESLFGGKAAQLAAVAAAALPVPSGLAVSWSLAGAIADDDPEATAELAAVSLPGDLLAVRSSGVGEDSEAASFAGQHLTLLGVTPRGVAGAVARVARSVRDARALAYRGRLGVAGPPRAGVVIQEMVDATVAGVLFRPHPLTGADEIVIEASWGLGEAVVNGLVTPDRFRVSPAGAVLERRPGVKDVEVVLAPAGGTAQGTVAGERTTDLCLEDRALERLRRLAIDCQAVFSGPADLEWAFAGDRLWLLQRRAARRARDSV
jgi:pyruvate,water dikinase